MRSRGEKRRSGPGRGGGTGSERLSATAFAARLKAGLIVDPLRSELLAGNVAWAPRVAGQEAEVLARLARELASAADAPSSRRAPAAVQAPLLRVGPADLWRPRLALVQGAGGGRPFQAGASFGVANVLLLVESGREGAAVEARLAGYAAAGVREAWLLDLREGWTVAYRSPWAGSYASRTLWYPGEAVPIGALQGRSVEALERGFRAAPAGPAGGRP